MKMLKVLKKLVKMFSLSENILHFIGGGEVLPQPFTPDEESEMVAKLIGGEKDIRDKLIEHNLRLVVYIARRFENTGVDLDDLVSVGTIGLIKAVNSFNADKNIKLATYASRCIENEILMHLRKINQQKGDVSLDEPLNTDWEGNELLLSDVLGSDGYEVNNGVEDEDERRILHLCMETLEERERLIMNMRFGLCGYKEHTQKEVADILGISQSYISRLEKRIISQLKRDIEKITAE